jgi:hypothetical protein
MKLLLALLLALAALAFGLSSPAAILVALVALCGQAQHPVYAPAVVLTPMSDRDLLASLLAREVHYGA